MKKFILVVFILGVLAMNLYGVINKLMVEEVKEIDHIAETTTMVYME